MNAKRAPLATLLLGFAALSLASEQAWADGAVTLKGAPAFTPSTLVPGKDATVTVEVAASKQDAKVVQLQVRIGAQVIGSFAGDSLGANKTGKYSVKIAVPSDAKNPVTLGIWGQGVLIGSATVPVGAAAPGPAVGGTSALVAAAGPKPEKIDARVEQVRSIAVDASVMAGSSAQGAVTLESAAGLMGTAVSLTSSSPSVTVPQSVRVAGGSSTATFEIMAVPGGAPGPVTLSAVVAGPGGVAKLATIRVWAPQQVQSLQRVSGECPMPIRGPAVYENVPLSQRDECFVKVMLDSIARGGTRVNLSSSRPDVTVPESAAVGAGSQDFSFRVQVAPNAGGGSVTITGVADRPNGVPKQLTLALSAPPAGQVTGLAIPPVVVEPGLTYNGTVVLDGPAGAAGMSVALNSSNPAVTVPPTVSVAAGASSAGFSLRVGASASGHVTVSAARSGPGNSVVSRTVKAGVNQVSSVSVNPLPFGGVFVAQWNPKSGDPEHSAAPITTTVRVFLEGPAVPGGVSVALNANEALTGVSVPASVLVPAGQTMAEFSATVGTLRKGAAGTRSNARITAVRSGQPASEAKSVDLPIEWH